MNPVLLQKQLRDNNNDLQDFCNDLKQWGEVMKKREHALKNDTSSTTKSATSPKVPKMDKQEANIKEKSLSKAPATRIGSTDYAKWDKFDVESECDKVDSNENEDSELTDEFDDTHRDAALVYKEKGNQFVKKQQWEEAIEYYTKAIYAYAYDPIFYANRALCFLKTGEMNEAERDCNMSLKLDKTYVKAYQRRAAAKEGLNKLEESHEDLLKVLEFEPKNAETIKAIERVKRKMGIGVQPAVQRPVSKFTASRNKTSPNLGSLKTSIEQDTSIFTKTKPIEINSVWPKDEIILVKSINKPPHLRSKKPLKRIEIVELNGYPLSTEEEKKEPDAVKKHVLEKIQTEKSSDNVDVCNKLQQNDVIKKHVDKIISQGSNSNVHNQNEIDMDNNNYISKEVSKMTSAFKKSRTENNNLINNESDKAWPKPNQQTNIIKSDDLSVVERKMPEDNTKDIKNVSNLSKSQELKISTEKSLDPPKSSVQFYSTWKDFKTPTEKRNYLKLVNPDDIPSIFKESLDINVFSDILDILSTQFIQNKDAVYKILMSFTQVKRFSAFTMFMNFTDKNRLLKLVTYVREDEQKSASEIDNLIKLYEL